MEFPGATVESAVGVHDADAGCRVGAGSEQRFYSRLHDRQQMQAMRTATPVYSMLVSRPLRSRSCSDQRSV